MDQQTDELLALATIINYKKNIMNLLITINDDELDLDQEEEDMAIKLRLLYETKSPPRITGYIVDVVNKYDDLQFQQNFRIKRVAFEDLLRIISINTNERGSVGRPPVELKHQLLAVIWLLATPDSYRSVSERFNMARSVLSNSCINIINELNSLMGRYIKWPSGAELQTTKIKFANNSIFKELVGVVDGTYVSLSVPKQLVSAYTNRKCYTSMTLQAICDSDMRYIDVYCEWPSSVPDIRIFKNSHIYERAQENGNNFFPNGEYILGDKAYPLLDWCITPYMNRGHLTQQQIIFNQKHSSCRQVIERSFALLFGRFRRLKQLDLKRTDWAPATITACCVLHNICLQYDRDIYDEYIAEGLSAQTSNSTLEDTYLHSSSNIDQSTRSGVTKRNEICTHI